MAQVDSLLTKYIEQHIDSQLGTEMTATIKKRIFDRYGISLTEAIKLYEPFDKTLREFFGRAADGVISRLFSKVCLIEKMAEISHFT